MFSTKPAVPKDIIEACRSRIQNVLEEQRIGPEMGMQDFDDYMNLMNGKDVEEIENFINGQPKFEQYCELIEHYKEVEHEIARKVSGVVTMGFYEFHREGLIETLESLARFMQQGLITKVTADQQNRMAKLASEYEAISEKLLSTPRDTKSLMELKEYATKTEEITIMNMEEMLRSNLQQLLFLTDYTILTPLEIKLNTNTFQCYLKMPSVFDNHKKIIAEKVIEYQEMLKKRIDYFKRDLETYWEQVQEYVKWGDIKKLPKYKKKATILDKKYGLRYI